jgi:hypothetical protein
LGIDRVLVLNKHFGHGDFLQMQHEDAEAEPTQGIDAPRLEDLWRP